MAEHIHRRHYTPQEITLYFGIPAAMTLVCSVLAGYNWFSGTNLTSNSNAAIGPTPDCLSKAQVTEAYAAADESGKVLAAGGPTQQALATVFADAVKTTQVYPNCSLWQEWNAQAKMAYLMALIHLSAQNPSATPTYNSKIRRDEIHLAQSATAFFQTSMPQRTPRPPSIRKQP